LERGHGWGTDLTLEGLRSKERRVRDIIGERAAGITMTTIERATFEDLAEVADLANLVWWDHFPGIISNAQIEYMLSKEYDLETMNRELRSGRVTYVKLIEDVELIGFASYGQTDDGDEMQVHKLYIHPKFQRMGYGSALLRYVEEEAVQNGYQHLVLAVNKNNVKAISAYLKNGFAVTESISVDIGNGFRKSDYIMKKRLIAH